MSNLSIRPAQLTDVPTIFQLIQALADYEQLSHLVTGNVLQLQKHLFGPRPYVEAVLAEVGSEMGSREAAGFALFLTNYSTFLTQPGLYLEDLFVLPAFRRQGIGKALLSYLAKLSVERGYGRFEWSVLDWNASAINFYETMGATVMPDWRICRVTGDKLERLARLV
jgi:GNAT superfamily N-acetyltransferase